MYLGCQCVILYLLILILVFVIKFYSDKCGESDKNNWYSILKNKIGILGIVFLFVFIAFLISNIVFTFLEKNQHIAESVLDYKDVVNLFPAYLTLAVTIIIAIIQFFIQDDLQKKAKEEQEIQQIHYEKIREIDIKAHMNEQLAESLKRYFYFDRYGKIKYLGNGQVEIFIRMLNETISCYFSIKISRITLKYNCHEIVISNDDPLNTEISVNELDLLMRLNNLDLHSMIKMMMEDALIGDRKTGELVINATVTDNSLNNFEDNADGERNTDIDLKIKASFQPNGQISPDDGICIDVYDMNVFEMRTRLSA